MLNKAGANIPYPYDVPLLTRNGYIGLWTMIGLRELIEDEANAISPPPPNSNGGGISFAINAGEPTKT